MIHTHTHTHTHTHAHAHTHTYIYMYVYICIETIRGDSIFRKIVLNNKNNKYLKKKNHGALRPSEEMIGLRKAVPNELWVTVLRDIALHFAN